MRRILLSTFGLALITLGCQKEVIDNSTDEAKSNVSLKPGATGFENVMKDSSQTMTENPGDHYNILGIRAESDKLFVTVGFGGGCENHDFEVRGELSKEQSQGTIAIVHHANNDGCKAYFNKELEIDLTDLLGTDQVDLTIFNPSQLETRYSSLAYRHLPQGGNCELKTTFQGVICGSGMYGNKWFGIEGEDLYLQPVLINLSVDDSQLLEGKQYKVGFWETVWQGDSTVVCMAYPGPSVMAEISCIEEM